MATSANTIKEFLVALGFKIDEAELKKFISKIEVATKEVFEFASTMTAAATAVGAAVLDIADHFEDLFWASRRIGAGAGNIKAFEYAATQMGVSAETARSTLEGLARTLRENPGLVGMLNGLGIKTEGRQTTDILTDFVERAKKMPFFMAQQYASQLGIDSDTLFMLEQNVDQMKAHQRDMADMYKEAGVNADDAANKSHNLMTELRRLGAAWDVLKSGMLKPLTPVGDFLTGLAEKALHLALNLNKATGGWSTVAGAVIGSSEGIAVVGNILFKVLGLSFRFKPLTAVIGLLTRTLIPALLLRLGLLAEALGMGGVASALTTLGAAIEATPIGWIITAIGILAFLGYELWKHWKDIGPMFDKTWHSITRGVHSVRESLAHPKKGSLLDRLGLHHGIKFGDQGPISPTWQLPTKPPDSKQAAWEAALASQRKYGIPALVTYAQWLLESGAGKHMPAGSNNPFGIKARAGEPFVLASTLESIHGRMIHVMAKFRQFASLSDAFEAHAALLAHGSRYVAARLASKDPYAFANALTGTYATDPQYGEKLGRLMHSINVPGLTSHNHKTVTVNAHSKIEVHGDSKPHETARAVHASQREHTATLVRNLQGSLI